MEPPKINSPIRDAARNITYNVLAYRALSTAERTQAVRIYLAQAKKKPKPGSTVTIISIIGYDDA